MVIDHLDDEVQVVRPDVSLTTPRQATGSPAAVAVAEPLPVRLRVPLDILTRLVSMYIRQRPNEMLVAVLELLSPVNKRRGAGAHRVPRKAPRLFARPTTPDRDRSPA